MCCGGYGGTRVAEEKGGTVLGCGMQPKEGRLEKRAPVVAGTRTFGGAAAARVIAWVGKEKKFA